MAERDFDFEEQDLYMDIGFDQQEFDQFGTWDDEDTNTPRHDDQHMLEDHTTLVDPAAAELVGDAEDGFDVADFEIAQELENCAQRGYDGYFIGRTDQRNAPSDPVETRPGEGHYESHDASGTVYDDREEESLPLVSANGTPSSLETDWAITDPTTEDWSLLDSDMGDAGSSTNAGTLPTSDQAAGQVQIDLLVCGHPGCGATYKLRSELRHHQRKHIPMAERPYACLECPGKRFLYKKDLNKHMQSRKHAAAPQFQCPRCRKGFTRGDLLNRHRQYHCHGTGPP